MKENDLGEFLHKNSQNSNKELADEIRAIKKLSNEHDNVVIYQEKRTINKAFDKLSKIIKAFDSKSELIVKTNNKQFKN